MEYMTDSEWLYEYQKLATDVYWWITHGKSETAAKAIDALRFRYANRLYEKE